MTPIALVNACIAMLPRLEAEESIVTSNRIAHGSGRLERGQALRLAREWSRAADEGRPGARPVPVTPDILEAAGIGVRVVTAP